MGFIPCADDLQRMDQLYPIIRRKRRPLVTESEPVPPAPLKMEPENLSPPALENPVAEKSEDTPDN